jgi:hypothetical protein
MGAAASCSNGGGCFGINETDELRLSRGIDKGLKDVCPFLASPLFSDRFAHHLLDQEDSQQYLKGPLTRLWRFRKKYYHQANENYQQRTVY